MDFFIEAMKQNCVEIVEYFLTKLTIEDLFKKQLLNMSHVLRLYTDQVGYSSIESLTRKIIFSLLLLLRFGFVCGWVCVFVIVLSHDADLFTDNEPSYSVHSRYIVSRHLVHSRRWLCGVNTERVPTVNRNKDKNNSVRSRCACSVNCVTFYSVRSRYTLGRESVYCLLTRQRLNTFLLECRFAVGVDFWESIIKIVGRTNGLESSSCEGTTECVTYFSATNSVHCRWKIRSCESPFSIKFSLIQTSKSVFEI